MALPASDCAVLLTNDLILSISCGLLLLLDMLVCCWVEVYLIQTYKLFVQVLWVSEHQKNIFRSGPKIFERLNTKTFLKLGLVQKIWERQKISNLSRKKKLDLSKYFSWSCPFPLPSHTYISMTSSP
jgi:hypothetical protein